MKGLQIKEGLQTIKAKTENQPLPSPRRLMGFREWCERFWKRKSP